MSRAEDSKLFCEVHAFGKIFRCDEVERYLDAVKDVEDLMRCTSWYENCVTSVLDDRVSSHSGVLKALAKRSINVPVLKEFENNFLS